LVTFNNM